MYVVGFFKANDSNKSKRELIYSEIPKDGGKNVPHGVLCALKGQIFLG